MTNYHKSFYEQNDELVQLLKDVNSVLLNPETSVIERYAGISEISRFKDWQNVGVLTVALLDKYSQVRELAANTLKQDYKLGETSDIVLELLANDAEKLKDAIRAKDEETFSKLISIMEKLHKKRSSLGKTKVNDINRHLLTILIQLEIWVRTIQGEAKNTETHPLKHLLEKDEHSQSLEIIKKCLESEDVSCRRRAILIIGKLNLDIGIRKQAFDLIIENIDNDDNRNNYLVTWDGIQALTVLVQQNPNLKLDFFQQISDIYASRTYKLDDKAESEEHCYHTKKHCIEALGSLFYYEEINKLLKISKPLDFLLPSNLRAISALKEAVVRGFVEIYSHNSISKSKKLKLQQRKILNKLIYWINSKDRYLKQAVNKFFTELPSLDHRLVREYLQKYIEHNYKRVAQLLEHLQNRNLNEKDSKRIQQKIAQLLAQRQNLATALGIMYARINRLSEYSTINNYDKNKREEVEQEKELLLSDSKGLANILVDCCLQRIIDSNERRLEKNLKPALRELLWTLYELGTNITDSPLLNIEQIEQLRYSEDDDSCRLVLALFWSRNSGDILQEQLNYLEQIATGDDKDLVKVCVEIEQLIKTKGRQNSLTPIAIKSIPNNLGKSGGIHPRLASLFIPLLAKMETEEATNIIKSILLSRDDSFKPLVMRLRNLLCEYQCYQLRDELAKILLQDLTRRYRNRENIRNGYLNLLAAGRYQNKKSQHSQLQFTQPDKFRQGVIKGFQDIQSKFRKLELPLLFPKEIEGEEADYYVAGLDSMTENSINTLLYKVNTMQGREIEKKFFKTYLYQFEDKDALVFLDRALTDAEIIKIILSHHKNDETIVNQTQNQNISDFVLGRVERIADDDNGLYVNIGLLHEYNSIFVHKSQIVEQKDEEEINWQEYTQKILGSVLKFSINITIDISLNKIEKIELNRREFWVHPLENPTNNITVRGNLVDFDLSDANNLSAIFKVIDVNKILKVKLPELSFRSDQEWIDNWQAELKKQESEEFEITYEARFKCWSLRNNPPKEEHFLQLLYENSQNTFDLVYVKRQQEGYIFEIKPGKLCYLPAERLLEISSKSDVENYSFLLSRNNLKQGTRLKKVVLTQDIDVSSKAEVILQIKESQIIPATQDMLPEGMRIFGFIKDLEDANQNLPQQIEIKKKNKAKLQPSPQEQPPGYYLGDYSIEIEGLPAQIKSGDEVSGQIIEVNNYHKKLVLKYIEETFDAIQIGQSYQCKVVYTPKPEDNRLLLRHSNIFGFIYERNITYGHLQSLPYFQKNTNLVARVEDKKEGKPRTVSLQVDRKVLIELGLEGQDSNGGRIISSEPDIITFEGKDYKPVTIALQDLKVKNRGNIPRINEGDRIYFNKTSSQEQLEMRLEAPLAFFSIRPRTNDKEKWSDWEDVMKVDRSYRCIYVDKYKQNYLLEYHPQESHSQPVFFALPARLTNGISEINALHTGDFVTIRLTSDESVSLESFEPGPLHFAATPQIFNLNKISWIQDSLLTNNQDKIIVIAKIIDTNYQHGIRIELQHLHFDDDKSIPLAKGIQGFYRFKDMSFSEQELFRKGDFRNDNEINIILAQPPEIREDKIWLTVESSNYIQKIKYDFDINKLRERLREIKKEWLDSDKKCTVKGTIIKYEEKEGAFQVSLDKLPECHQQDYCWLPVDEISESLVHSYTSLEDFGDELQKEFTIIDVYPDDELPELEVSLILNYPILNIEEAVEEFDWSDGTILKLATFLEYKNLVEENYDNREEISSNPVRLVSIEIKPGFIVDIPAERFFVEGLEYESDGKQFGLQRGDQLTLWVKIDKERNKYSLDVIKFVRAEFNLLSDKHKIVYGEIKDSNLNKKGSNIDKNIQLKLQGYSKVKCLLHPDFIKDANKLSKRKDILFRVSDLADENKNNDKKQDIKLYFEPITKQDLKQGDRLKVRYEKMEGNPPNRLKVIFGENQQGYISRFDITYRPGFELSQFDTEADDYFNAVVKQDVSETSDVKLSLKNPPIRGINYFLNKDYGKTIKAVIIKNNYKQNNLDIEVKPNIWVRVPYARFWGIRERSNELKPGNVLLFQVVFKKRDSQIYLKLEDIEENNLLGKHLSREMLVRAQFNYKVSFPKESKFVWRYFLPDYGGVEAKLETKDGFKRDADYETLLKLVTIPQDPSYPIILRDRSQGDPQQRLYVDSPISGDRIKMLGGDGKVVYLQSYYATYRINNRITYLRRQLQPGEVIAATRIEKFGKKLLSLRYDNNDEQSYNKPLPLTYLQQFLQEKQRYSKDLELTYVRSENKEKEQIFEFQPGKLILIPTSLFYFYGYPVDKNQFKRFLPGDIFTVKLEIPSLEDLEQLRLNIQTIEFCILHKLQRNQIIEAEVKEVIHEASGIIIKAKHLDLEYFVKKFISGKSAYDYKVGQSIWLIVDRCDYEDQEIYLKEIPNDFSIDNALDELKQKQLNDESKPKKRINNFYFAYAKINENSKNRRNDPSSISLTLEVPQTRNINIYLSEILWSDNKVESNINDILAPNQQGIWVSIHKNSKNHLYVRAKSIHQQNVKKLSSQLKNQPHIIIQARVVKCNHTNKGTVETVLLDVDGVRILIAHKDLVRGAQNQPCVESNMWVPVCLERAEYDIASNKVSLSVVSQNISELDKLAANKAFSANVCYTLEHGLVFIYKQTLGYIPNDKLAWSVNVKAADMFAPGDAIKVYRNQDNTFSLKHILQIKELEIGQEIQAENHRQVNNSVYLKVKNKVKNTDLFLLFSSIENNFELEEQQIILQLEDINMTEMLVDFRPLNGITIDSKLEVTTATEESISEIIDCYYMTTFKNFDSQWQEIVDSVEISEENENSEITNNIISSLIKLLNDCKIPYTYTNIRKIIAKLINKPYTKIIWKHLADYQPENDNHIIYILCQVARKLTGNKLLSSESNLDSLVYYALGIIPIVDSAENTTIPITALENLLYAYKLDKSIDIQIALLIIYEQRGYFQLRKSILKQIVTSLSQNINWLLKLPVPLDIDTSCYPRLRKNIPGVNQTISQFAESIKNICENNIYSGKIKQAEQRLQDKWNKIRIRRINMPELVLNIAICRILQNDWQGSLNYIEQAVQILSKQENLRRFNSARQAYYQLAIYANYQLGRFSQLQNLIIKGFQENVGDWLETLLAYIFFNTGNYHLSQDIIKRQKQLSKLKKNVNALEHILLDLYWQDTEFNQPTDLKRMNILLHIFKREEQITSWTNPALNIRLFPNPKGRELRFNEKVSYGKQYNTPEYALEQYYQKPAHVKFANEETVKDLVEIAVSFDKLEDAKNILIEYRNDKLSFWFSQELLLVNEFSKIIENSSSDNQSEVFDSSRKIIFELEGIVSNLIEIEKFVPGIDEYSGYLAMQIIERWIKSSYNHNIAQKLTSLFESNPALRNLFWNREDLRTLIWQAMDTSHDYGSIVKLIPTYLIEDVSTEQDSTAIIASLITLSEHNFVNKNTILNDIIQDIKLSNSETSKKHDPLNLLLPTLRELDDKYYKLVEKIQLLNQGFKHLNKNT